jgi:hypothetical protein
LVIPIISFEQLFVKALRDYVHVSTSELDLQVPCTVELGLTGLDSTYLACPGGEMGNGTFEGPIMQDHLQRVYTLGTANDDAVMEILRSFFINFYDLAARARSEILTDELVKRFGLPRI